MAIPNAIMGVIFNVMVAFAADHKVDVSKIEPSQVACLAENIYFEAKGETVMDRIVVANVTLNRVKHPEFPKTVCGVVHQPKQFSWVGKAKKIKDFSVWQESVEIAVLTSTGLINDYTNGALYFHRDHLKPVWAKSLEVVKVHAVSGKHVVLKEK